MDAMIPITFFKKYYFTTILIISLLLLLFIAYLHVVIGVHLFSFNDIVELFFTKDTDVYAIITTIRLPRTFTVIFAGSALAIAGFLSQLLTKNPIATPQVLGINSLVVFVSIFIQVTLPALSLFTPLIAIGAVFLFACIIAFFHYQSQQSMTQISLIGIAFNLVFASVTQIIIMATEEQQEQLFFWLVGGVNHATWSTVLTLLPYIAISFIIILFAKRSIEMLQFDEEMLTSLGVSIKRTQIVTILAIALLIVGVVSLCGPIAFVGLVVPHVTRRFTPHSFSHSLLLNGLFGAIFLLLADVAAKLIFFPQEIYVGVMSALIGSLFFFLILLKLERQKL